MSFYQNALLWSSTDLLLMIGNDKPTDRDSGELVDPLRYPEEATDHRLSLSPTSDLIQDTFINNMYV